MGDVGEAIEEMSGHLLTTHVHDNRRRADDHLPPFAGSIDWDVAMMETQKIGYDGVLMFEVADTGDAAATLQRCADARERLENTFVTFSATHLSSDDAFRLRARRTSGSVERSA